MTSWRTFLAATVPMLSVGLLLSGSTVQQKTIVFTNPIDAISIGFQTDDPHLSIRVGNTWQLLEIEKEFDPTLRESNLILFPESVITVTLKGDTHDIELHPIRLDDTPASYQTAATQFYYGKPRILSRRDWGADDSLLLQGQSVTRSDEPQEDTTTTSRTPTQREIDCTTAQEQYPEDFAVQRTITHAPNGQAYRWAKRYSPEVRLLVVHHTAMKISEDHRSGVERMRALYEYHANNRGWGDIGYHYLIDEDGTIYEGRDGGDYVVGGHAYCANVGSIGIAMLGNFDLEQPTQDQVQALQWLLADLADHYDIDPSRKIQFHGKLLEPILRHKDLVQTQCPGYYMSAAIGQVRSHVIAGTTDASVTFPTIAQTQSTVSREERIATRIQDRLVERDATATRRVARAQRLVRTASRRNTTDPRASAYKTSEVQQNNVQRLRAAAEKRALIRQQVDGTQSHRSKDATTSNEQAVSTLQEHARPIRIRLSYDQSVATITSSAPFAIGNVHTSSVQLGIDNGRCVAINNSRTIDEGIVRLDAGDHIFTIESWRVSTNRFRGVLECRVIDGELVLINELPLEQYIAGLAEEPDSEPWEKQRAFAIAARSYAAHYMLPQYRKFPNMPYDGDDSPTRFQKYGGVAFEEANPRWVQAANNTAGKVISKEGGIVKTAYFSSDDGRTRSPAENGWGGFPYEEVFSSKPDPWCVGMELRGHGVGMSGCGAEGQALEGKTAEQILSYYYPHTDILSLSLLALQF